MNKQIKMMTLIITFVVLICVLAMMLTGCRQAFFVSQNVSRQADNFNVTRRVTVINTRTDKVLMQMVGKISIEDVENGVAVIVEIDRKKSIYQKHYIYLNGNTMYTVEDVSGIGVSKYAYEMEFMPQSIVPVRVTADEIKQDVDDTLDD